MDNDQVGADGKTAPAISEPGTYIGGYQQLLVHRVGFYPIHPDKSPAVQGKLDRVATIDPLKIRFWAEHCHHRSFAARFLKRCRVFVIDTENPFKHCDRLGPDCEMFLGSLLEDTDIALPPCPTVQTASGGFHRYLLVPKWLRIRSTVALWPGIDILAAGSNVVLPGSRTDAGEYRPVRTFDECGIPEAPHAFVNLIRRVQSAQRTDRQRAMPSALYGEVVTSEVSRRQWWLLFRNRVFRSFWRRQGKAGDATDSAYEYHLAKACFCCGLNHRQTEQIVVIWRRKHGLQRSLRKLQVGIIPKAWAEVEPWVTRWHAEREAAMQSRDAAKTVNLILAQIRDTGTPQMPSSIASALAIPRERVKKAMQRMAREGKLEATPEGYKLA